MANIVEKWNFCYQKYKDGNPEDPENAPAVDSKCVCFERDNVEADPKMGIEGGTISLFVILRTNLPKRNLRCAKKVRILKRFWAELKFQKIIIFDINQFRKLGKYSFFSRIKIAQ